MLKIFKYLKKKEWIMIAFSIVFICCQVYLDLRLPDYMSEITLLVQTEGTKISQILVAGSWMLGCALGSMLASIIVGYFAARTASSFSQRLRELVYNKTLDFSLEEINKFSIASLITRSTNDITQIQQVVAMGLQAMIKAPILAVWAIIKIANKNFEWTMITAVAVVFLLCIVMVTITLALPKTRTIQKLTDNLNSVTRENLTGLRVIRAYNAEDYQEEKFEKANKELMSTNLFVNRVMAIMSPGMSLISSGLTLGIYWIGSYLINDAGMIDKLPLFSDMVVFSSYAMQVIMAFMMLTMIFIILPRATVSAKRILAVLDTKTKIIDGSINHPTTEIKAKIEFKNVSFKYPDAKKYVLKDISFEANKGDMIAIIGSTGSGKSTISNLIPRFYDVSEGEILIDDINIKDYSLDALREKIGYVSQSAVMFTGNVTSNVALGQEKIDQLQLETAIEIAQGKDFVEALDDQYNAKISQGGTNISGGQKQRLSIARAIYKDPEIFVFDDSFSALDYQTDANLRKALNQKMDDKISIIIAQRIGTILHADQIIVLDKGEIVGKGTHKELLENCKTYQEIAYSQLSKEELSNES